MERAVPILSADDLRIAKEFYVEKLGFQILFESEEGSKDGLLGLQRGSIELTIDNPMSGHGRDACVSLRVDSADAYYDEWRERVEIRRPPTNEPWGGRTFGLMDPFGNTIFVIGRSCDPAPRVSRCEPHSLRNVILARA
ncbi:MAG TPA: glyoxalase superfamily protein [Thermoanaerobaculia bacterium]|nr:glyoxalase superfamily protein [Thermoanaerobaculia bacterium]